MCEDTNSGLEVTEATVHIRAVIFRLIAAASAPSLCRVFGETVNLQHVGSGGWIFLENYVTNFLCKMRLFNAGWLLKGRWRHNGIIWGRLQSLICKTIPHNKNLTAGCEVISMETALKISLTLTSWDSHMCKTSLLIFELQCTNSHYKKLCFSVAGHHAPCAGSEVFVLVCHRLSGETSLVSVTEKSVSLFYTDCTCSPLWQTSISFLISLSPK